jgi:hypothetical protein
VNSVDQKYKFQEQEHIDDLDLACDSFKWRNHQSDIGRFFNVDPLAEKYVYNSSYAFSENHVTSHVELEGMILQLAGSLMLILFPKSTIIILHMLSARIKSPATLN